MHTVDCYDSAHQPLAASMGLDFGRVQFTPDMLPADVTGLHINNRHSGEFELKKGPVFLNALSCSVMSLCLRPHGL